MREVIEGLDEAISAVQESAEVRALDESCVPVVPFQYRYREYRDSSLGIWWET